MIGLRIAGGATVWATPDHKVLTEYGWRQAGNSAGRSVAQPRRFDGFGDSAPISADHARLLGYLIGDGYVGVRLRSTSSMFSRHLADDGDANRCDARLCGPSAGRISLAIAIDLVSATVF